MLAKIHTLISNDKISEALTVIGKWCIGPLSIFKKSTILLLSRYNEIKTKELQGQNQDNEKIIIKRDILDLAEKIDYSEINEDDKDIESLLSSSLLIRDSFPFIDRKEFRKKIKKAFFSDDAELIFVEGTSKSGMSYLEKFLKNLINELEISLLIPIEVPAFLGDPDIVMGEELARSILIKFDLDLEIDLNRSGQFKFTQFINKLKKKMLEDEKIPVFFLHDFHKIESNDSNLLEFIYVLIDNLSNKFPKCLFIIAGLEYQNIRLWHSELEFIPNIHIYKIEPIEESDVIKCLKDIFLKFKSKICEKGNGNISIEEYTEGMLKKLIGDNEKIDITSIGLNISRHLKALKN